MRWMAMWLEQEDGVVENFSIIELAKDLVRRKGVRGFFYSLGRPRDPSWIFDKCQGSKGRQLNDKNPANEFKGF